MRVAVVADAHLGGAGGPAEEFIRQLRGLPQEDCARLVLLGDIFHVWVGEKRFETAAIAAVYEQLLELKSRGVVIDYIEGNRDFFLAGSAYEDAFSSIGFETDVQVGDTRYLAVHGDGLDPHDRQYRFWRWLSKSALSRGLVLNLPTALSQWSLDRTEAQLAKTNFEHRQSIPREAISEYASSRLAEGYDELLLGHYHEPVEWAVEGGKVRIFDAWFHSRRIEWL